VRHLHVGDISLESFEAKPAENGGKGDIKLGLSETTIMRQNKPVMKSEE
jgi:hypothetical protein